VRVGARCASPWRAPCAVAGAAAMKGTFLVNGGCLIAPEAAANGLDILGFGLKPPCAANLSRRRFVELSAARSARTSACTSEMANKSCMHISGPERILLEHDRL